MQVKQWMNGAALHVHMLLHLERLTNSSDGEVLSLDYLHHVDPLLKTYREYLVNSVLIYSFIYIYCAEIYHPLAKATPK